MTLPGPGARFEADAGVDWNHDTAGQRGSVVLAVDIAGREVFRSGTRRCADPPLRVDVPLDGARELTLRVLDAGDGPGWDQTDWAGAAVTLEDGRKVWLDELPLRGRAAEVAREVPFSFVYGGKPSAELLPGWRRSHEAHAAAGGRERHVVAYADPATGLEVTCEATLFADHPAVEWVLRLRNGGSAPSPLLEAVRSLQLTVAVPARADVVLRHAHGSTCEATDFLPLEAVLKPRSEARLAPNGGRSSDGRLPFFGLEWPGGGLLGAIGWSGQWSLAARRDEGGEVLLDAGQETTRFRLEPGEAVRTPRILLVAWEGPDPMRGHNLLRKLLLSEYVPRRGGEPALPPVTQNTWFTFSSGNGVTEANQLAAIDAMAPLGVECYWLDAGWFEGGWPSGAGSWVPRADAFPRGLRPLADAAHAKGMRFVVWFEPERVAPGSRIAKEHPQWVLHAGPGDGLFDLGDPAALGWLADYLSRCIREWGIDVYRNDFNIDPLRFWRAADAPERQGIAEIRYVEGLYALWDALLERNPGLLIDSCASGGRRIDLETLRRSLPLWRSDTQGCGWAMPIQDQAQTAGLSLWVPLHAAGVWDLEPYSARSVATTGFNLCMDARAEAFSPEVARRAIEEVKSLRPLWLGDYRPLVEVGLDEWAWCAWQLHREDLGRGCAVFFRRLRSPYTSMEASLRGLDPAARYEATLGDSKEARFLTGAELARLVVSIDEAPGRAVLAYRAAGAREGPEPAGVR
ncbi:MAG: alpha-galactosidase [Planctomycetes bacterium]|nr:alpha-galactosidase [Planctomycetota bacterium]